MIGEYPADELEFEGIGVSGSSTAEAAQLLAEALTRWGATHAQARIVQLDMPPAVQDRPAADKGGASFAAMALITYVSPVLDGAAAAEAVAAAVEEIHEAQVVTHEE